MEPVAIKEIEVRREKVLVPSDMTVKEIMAKYNIFRQCRQKIPEKGW